MNTITDFIKDIFMISNDKSLVGLSSIKTLKKKSKRMISKPVKKVEPKLSDLMRRSTNNI